MCQPIRSLQVGQDLPDKPHVSVRFLYIQMCVQYPAGSQITDGEQQTGINSILYFDKPFELYTRLLFENKILQNCFLV